MQEILVFSLEKNYLGCHCVCLYNIRNKDCYVLNVSGNTWLCRSASLKDFPRLNSSARCSCVILQSSHKHIRIERTEIIICLQFQGCIVTIPVISKFIQFYFDSDANSNIWKKQVIDTCSIALPKVSQNSSPRCSAHVLLEFPSPLDSRVRHL